MHQLEPVLAILALVLFAASTVLLAIVRRASRVSLITDLLIWSSAPLTLVAALGLYIVEPASATPLKLAAWLAIQVILDLVGLYYFFTAIFLWRTLRYTEGFVIISRGLLEGLHSRLDKMYGPGPARIITYSVGKDAGTADSAGAVQTRMFGGERLWSWLPYIFRLTGYGGLHVKDIKPGKEVRLRVKHSFEVFQAPDGEHEHNGCDLTRGYLAGIGRSIHPTLECQAEETRCGQIHGGDTCEFTIRWFEPVKSAPAGA